MLLQRSLCPQPPHLRNVVFFQRAVTFPTVTHTFPQGQVITCSFRGLQWGWQSWKCCLPAWSQGSFPGEGAKDSQRRLMRGEAKTRHLMVQPVTVPQ